MAELLRERFAVLANPLDDSDWLDVRRRAGIGKRRRPIWIALAAAIAAVAVLLTTPALGLRGRIVQLFEESEPASEKVVRNFATMNLGVPHNMPGPGVIASETRELMRIPVGPGKEAVMWVAPTKAGGFCNLVGVRKIGTLGAGGGGGCLSARQLPFTPGMTIPGAWSPEGRILRPPVLVSGAILIEAAATIELRYEDGDETTLPLLWVSQPIDAGFFLYAVPQKHWLEGHRPTAIVALDGQGRELARESKVFWWPEPYRRDGIPIEAVVAEKRKLVGTKLENGDSAAMWVAPSKTGGRCEWLTLRNRSTIYSSCSVEPTERPLQLGTQQGKDHVLLHGHVGTEVELMELLFEDGEVVRLRPVDSTVLYAIPAKHFPRGARLELILALDGDGRELGRELMRTREPGIYPCDEPVPIGEGQTICP